MVDPVDEPPYIPVKPAAAEAGRSWPPPPPAAVMVPKVEDAPFLAVAVPPVGSPPVPITTVTVPVTLTPIVSMTCPPPPPFPARNRLAPVVPE
jgi:hypothetical protein